MKKHPLAAGCAIALASLLSGGAQAASHVKVVFIDQYDQDDDGKVSSVEFETARRQRFDLTDQNHDGVVDPEEYVLEWEDHLDAQLALDRKEQVEQTAARFHALDEDANASLSREEFVATGESAWKRYDSNGDAVINAADPDAAGEQRAHTDDERSYEEVLVEARRTLSMPSTHSKAGTIEAYDEDGDDAVSRAEFDAVRDATFARTDADGNGAISEEEYRYEFEDRVDAAIAATRKGQVDQTYVRFGALDRDDDKRMTYAEYQSSGHRSFGRNDTDGDGYVSFDEPDPVTPEFTREEVDAEQRGGI